MALKTSQENDQEARHYFLYIVGTGIILGN